MSTKDYLINLWAYEMPASLECIRSVPDDKSGYTPNPKSRTAKEIVEHIIGHPLDLIEAIDAGVIHHNFAVPVSGMKEAADIFESKSSEFIEKLKNTDTETWDNRIIKFYVMGNEFEKMTMPLRDMCWAMFRDIIHHRGQLSTYYRPMGVRNPSIYGPTREMTDEMMAAIGKN